MYIYNYFNEFTLFGVVMLPTKGRSLANKKPSPFEAEKSKKLPQTT